MLDRLIGENVSISFKPGKDLWPIRMDPAQLDQILANLAVNARDAIAEVGAVTIVTANTTLGSSRPCRHPSDEVKPGEYVLLSFSDTGQGMDAKTREQIFEPYPGSQTRDPDAFHVRAHRGRHCQKRNS